MPYLIDGHNLIPRLPGLSLAEPDDEMHLVQLLQDYCRRQRKRAEIFFDNAPPGQPRARSFGLVVARFVRSGQTADDAIRSRLERLGAEARNWTVVSSDQQVQRAARAARAQVLASETFARLILQVLETHAELPRSGEEPLTAVEIQEWMELFQSKTDDEVDES